MKISQQGLDLLIEREALRTNAYLDSKGIPTIGVGHTGPEVHLGLVWTVEKCREVFAQDLEWVERAIREGVKVPLEQFQHDALGSFIFNVGAGDPTRPETGGFLNSTLLKRINAGLMDEAAAQFDRWHIPAEIASRRNAEREQFKGNAFEARITDQHEVIA